MSSYILFKVKSRSVSTMTLTGVSGPGWRQDASSVYVTDMYSSALHCVYKISRLVLPTCFSFGLHLACLGKVALEAAA